MSSSMPHHSARPRVARPPARRWSALLVCLCTLLAGALHAAERRYYFDDNNSVQGLAQHTVHAFFQDRTGYIWIGTQGGLHKYDGYTYQLFRHVAGDSDSLPDSFVTALAQDGDGRLWVGGRIRGLAALDPLTGKLLTR